MTENTFDDMDEEKGPDKRLLFAGGAVGAVALIGVGIMLTSGGGGKSDSGGFLVPHGHPKVAAGANPSGAATSPDATIVRTSVTHPDPFQVPVRILQALAPAPSASPSPAAGASSTSPGTPATSTDGGTPATSTGGGTVTPTKSSVQFIQLLGAKKAGSTWKVTVRTNHGTCTGVKEGTAKVCGTDFSFVGEDESTGKATYVFVFGEVQGGNLTPDAKQKATPVKAGDHALVAVNGKVDGGITGTS